MKLVEKLVIDKLSFILFEIISLSVWSLEHEISECRDVIELLKH